MVRAAEIACGRGGDVLTMMLHSSELMPGGSPYLRTKDDVGAFLDRMERTLETVRERTGAIPRTLREVPRDRRAGGTPASAPRGGGAAC